MTTGKGRLQKILLCVCMFVCASSGAVTAQKLGSNISAVDKAARIRGSKTITTSGRTIPDTFTDSAAARRSIATFLMDLAVSLPTMSGVTDTLSDDQLLRGMSRISKDGYENIRKFAGDPIREIVLRDYGFWMSSRFVPLLPWMDSVAQAWHLADDQGRVAWCLGSDPSFPYNLERALFHLTDHAEYLAALERVAESAMTLAAHTHNVRRADRFNGLAYLLSGGIALARADTARALRLLRMTVRWPRNPAVRSAVQSLFVLTKARNDTAERFMALTLQQLLIDARFSGLGDGGVELRNMYQEMTTKGIAPPDLFPERMRGDPPPSSKMSLDTYLDRQWSGIFDRMVPIETVTVPGRSDRSQRLTIVEYTTGVGCSGCWVEDIGLQSLARRYPTDQVLTLAWHGHMPTAPTQGQYDWWARYADWYPRFGMAVSKGVFGSDPGKQRIPLSTLVTSTGDTLGFYQTFVNGRGLSRRQTQKWTYFEPTALYQKAVAQVDMERKRAPEISIHADVYAQQDSLLVRVSLDSLLGNHKKLALRIALIQDTVWKRGGNDRRIYTNVVQDAAHDDTLELGLPLSAIFPQMVSYSFDLAAIQAARLSARDEGLLKDPANLGMRLWYPDPRDWELDRSRLYVVTFVQDLESGDILQAARTKVPITTPSKTIATQLMR